MSSLSPQTAMAGTAEAKKYGSSVALKSCKEIHKVFQNDQDEGAEEGGP
jgi:hypothetical protein